MHKMTQLITIQTSIYIIKNVLFPTNCTNPNQVYITQSVPNIIRVYEASMGSFMCKSCPNLSKFCIVSYINMLRILCSQKLSLLHSSDKSFFKKLIFSSLLHLYHKNETNTYEVQTASILFILCQLKILNIESI